MINQQTKLQFVIRTICLGCIIGTMVWLIVLASTASSMRARHTQYGQVKAGLLVLNEIKRRESAGTTTISLSFKAGFIPYFLVWGGLGSLLGLWQARQLVKD